MQVYIQTEHVTGVSPAFVSPARDKAWLSQKK